MDNIAQLAALRRTALHTTHRGHKARMVDFGGWDMPMQYRGLIEEHMAVRTGVGVFDVSHMGDIQLRGPNSLAAVQRLLMNDASKLQTGQAHYSAMLYPNGTFVDDVVLHKLGENDYLIVINAGTREKDVQWVRQVIGGMGGVHVMDVSDYYTQLAIQGPKAQATLQKLTGVDLQPIKNYWFTWGQVAGCHNVLIARTGYTGEDGFEIYIPADEPTSSRVWGEVLGRYCKLDKGVDFVGREALQAIADAGGPAKRLVGLEMLDRGIGRDGYPVLSVAGERIGYVTSGSPAPFLKKNIALAYVPMAFAALETEVAVEIRGVPVRARVVPTPFYKRAKVAAPTTLPTALASA